MARRIAPDHVGALKGLAFLYFKVGDVQQAAVHLEAAQRVAPDDPGIAQALALARGGSGQAAAAEQALAPSRLRSPPPRPSRSGRNRYSRGSRVPTRGCCCSTRRAACWAAPSRTRGGRAT